MVDGLWPLACGNRTLINRTNFLRLFVRSLSSREWTTVKWKQSLANTNSGFLLKNISFYRLIFDRINRGIHGIGHSLVSNIHTIRAELASIAVRPHFVNESDLRIDCWEAFKLVCRIRIGPFIKQNFHDGTRLKLWPPLLSQWTHNGLSGQQWSVLVISS